MSETSNKDVSSIQARIDAITWYHEFDFDHGLKARSNSPDIRYHRNLWRFIEKQLDVLDFQGKSVLDVGCWDGYWSFYAERRGAKSVLATDDQTQNWSTETGLGLARELLKSSIEVNQDVSVYRLTSLKRKFDIILFLGVYYHLFDPFYALAQIRDCCHSETLVLIDGPEALALPPGAALHDYPHHNCEWLPSWEAMEQLIRATYFSVVSHETLDPGKDPQPPDRLDWKARLNACAQALRGSRSGIQSLFPPLTAPPTSARRLFVQCVPWEGANELHAYRPPFGLHRFDSRFRGLEDGS